MANKENGYTFGRKLWEYVKRMFAVLAAIWLIGDQVSDVVNTKNYYDKAVNLSSETLPINAQFIYDEHGTNRKDAIFFF